MTECLLVSTTTPTEDAAAALAKSAVRAKLAASAQVAGPVASVFWHQGELGTGQEWQVLLKTTTAAYPALEAHLISEHPWDTPEVTALPLTRGSTAYLDWVRRATSAPQ